MKRISKEKRLLLLRSGFHKEFAYKSMFKEGFSPVIIDKPTSEGLNFADSSYLVQNIWDTDEMFEVAKKAYIENECSGIISFLDSSTLALGKLSDYFGLNYYDKNTAMILSNKIKVRQKLQKHDLNNVKFNVIETEDDILSGLKKISYPFVLKPSDRSASKGVIIIHKKNEISEAYEEVKKYSKNKTLIMEEYIDGKEFCAEMIIIQHISYLLCISEKEVTSDKYCIELVDITPATLSDEMYNNIQKYLKLAVEKFDFKNGVVHIEFKIDNNDTIKLIEINPRCAGGNLLESFYHLSGYNVYKNLFYLAIADYSNIEIPSEFIGKQLEGYTLHNTFLYQGIPGRIKSLEGLNIFNVVKKYSCERMTLNVKPGDYIGESKNNEDSLGTIYLRDMSYEKLKKRNCIIEEGIRVLVD